MGATNVECVFPDSTPRAEIIKTWNADVLESMFQDGNSYSGEIGMFGQGIAKWVDRQFPSEASASEYLLNYHQKFNPAMAVSFLKDGAKFWLIGGWVSC